MDYYARFCDDLKLRGYAKRSRQSYLRAMHQFQNCCGKPLDEITEADLRKYWLCCKDDLKWSPATIRISYSGIKHFFNYTIKRDWPIFSEFKLETSQSLRAYWKTHRYTARANQRAVYDALMDCAAASLRILEADRREAYALEPKIASFRCQKMCSKTPHVKQNIVRACLSYHFPPIRPYSVIP